MPKLNFERHVPYSPEQMLALTADLAAYPDFLPNCSDMQVERDQGQPGDVRMARMAIKFGPVSQAYTSRVDVDMEAGTIRARAIDGPFSHLDSLWQFSPEGTGCEVRFDIDFGFSNPLIAAVAEPAFAAKQKEILDAFLTEADRRYASIPGFQEGRLV
jgi:coenzyme Q-binding protein COQ10